MSAAIDGQSTDVSDIIADIVGITQELFPGEVSAYLLDDPEYPQSRFTVIEAQASGSVEDVVERRGVAPPHITAR